MGEDKNTPILGKKIFFLHPSVLVQNEIVTELAQLEHEVYVVRDEDRLAKVLRAYADAIVFCSVDETLSPQKWEAWIRKIMGDEATRSVSIGILSNGNDDEVRRLYLNTLGVSCGFVCVKAEKNALIKTLSDILKAAEAKGRRKYLRADTRNEALTTLNLSRDGRFINGDIQDISVVGLSCVFERDPELEKNSVVSDVQLKLQSTLLKVEGVVFGSRTDAGGAKVYVIVFAPKMDPSVRPKIRAFIQKHLQTKMDVELGHNTSR
ncbi:MAG: PilZ domain-containing protein [Treponema sp.]|jgi:hypothetical protein|nr:PilZ domain-containing protein [Treponema sp.]